MPYCPTCRAEFVEDVRRCVDCDVDLVEVLPELPPEPTSKGDLAVVFEGTFFQANLLRGLLDEVRIPSVILEARPYDGFLGEAAQPMFQRVLVSSTDHESHRAEIEEFLQLVGEAAEEPPTFEKVPGEPEELDSPEEADADADKPSE